MMDDSNIVIDSKVIAESIKNIRLTHNLSQEEFAKVLNVSPKLVSKWENGARIPRIETFKLINKKYGITFEEITTGLFKPELTEEKAIEYLFKQRITKIIIIISIIIIMFLSALINNKESGYTFVVNTKDFIINKAHLMILSDDYYFDFEEIDKADYVKGKTYINIYLKQEKRKLLYSCKLVDNTCSEIYKNKIINSKILKNNLDNIYLEIRNLDKRTETKVDLLKYDNNQQIRNTVNITNNLIEHNNKGSSLGNCIQFDKKTLYSQALKIYLNKWRKNKTIFIEEYNKSIIIKNKNVYVIFSNYDSLMYFGKNNNILFKVNYNNKMICFYNNKDYYTFFKNIIEVLK